VVHQWVFQYDYRSAAVACLALSCAVAVGVNVSQFACLGRFSAVSYQARVCATSLCFPMSLEIPSRFRGQIARLLILLRSYALRRAGWQGSPKQCRAVRLHCVMCRLPCPDGGMTMCQQPDLAVSWL